MIKKHGGVFGRNPTFNDVTVEGDLNISGALTIDGETITALDYQGTWDASTNTPTLTSSTGNTGEVYIVSTTGTTTLDGISNWGAGDMLVFSGTQWERIEGSPDGNFVNVSSSGTASFTGAITVTGTANFNGTNNVNADMDFADNVKANFGADSDLQIYHDGSNSFISDTGTGSLILRGSSLVALQGANGENGVVVYENGDVDLRYDNSSKLATTSTGIDVTGTITADGLTVSTDGYRQLLLTYPDAFTSKLQVGSSNFYVEGSATTDVLTIANNSSGQTYFKNQSKTSMVIDNSGDISFYEDTGTTPKFFWDASAERLAIGTSSPTAKLSIADNYPFVHFNSASNVTQAFAGFHYDFNAMLVGTSTAIPLRLHTNNTERMRIDSSGNVGIGTSSPSDKLHINNSSGDAYVRLTNNASNRMFIGIEGSEGVLYSQTSAGAAQPMAFHVGSSEAMRINSSGYVGIGTTSPSGTLSLDSDGSSQSVITTSGDAATYANLEIGGYVGTPSIKRQITFHTNEALSSRTERMRINSSGNVGIGTSSPAYRLEISTANNTIGFSHSDSSDNPRIFTKITTGNDGEMFLKNSLGTNTIALTTNGNSYLNGGNVGIGTNSPGHKLDVAGSARIGGAVSGNVGLRIVTDASSQAYLIFGDPADESTGAVVYDNSTDHMQFNTNNEERMRIDSSGNLVIGSTTYGGGVGTSATGITLSAPNHYIAVSRSSGTAAFFNRSTSDGTIVDFRKDGSQVGSIGTAYSTIYIGDEDTGLLLNGPSDNILPVNPSTGLLRDNAIDFGSTSNRFKDLYLSGGAYIGGTGSANYLDDYEEGDFTPTLYGGNSAGTSTYTHQAGRYTKIGRQVTVDIYVGVSSATGTGNLYIGGLPFTRTTTSSGSGSVMVDQYNWSSGTYLTAFIQQNTAYIEIYSNTDDATWNRLGMTNEVQRFLISYTYFTS